jgi:Flp pilus assembly protein TadG
MRRLAHAKLHHFGQSNSAILAVEFAIVFPLFMAVLFGIIIYGSYPVVVHGVEQFAAKPREARSPGCVAMARWW